MRNSSRFLLSFIIFSFFASCNNEKNATEENIMAQVAEQHVMSDTTAHFDTIAVVAPVIKKDSIIPPPKAVIKKAPPVPVENVKPTSTKPASSPKGMSPPKSMPPTMSAPPSESEGMGGAPPSNEDMEMMPEAPKGIRNPVGPNKSNALKKQKPK